MAKGNRRTITRVIAGVVGVLALCLVCLAGGNPRGAGTPATATSTSSGSPPTLSITVTNNKQYSIITDFHLLPPEDEEFDTSGLTFPSPPTGWGTPSPSKKKISWATTQQNGIAPGQSVTFQVQLPAGANLGTASMDWVATTNGKTKYTDADIHDTGPTTNDPDNDGDNDKPIPTLPLLSMKTTLEPSDPNGEVAIGSSLSLALHGTTAGLAYRVCHSEGRCPVTPTPSAWGLLFSGLDGFLDSSAEATATVTVPNDPALIGTSFYVILKAGPAGGAKTDATGPVSITIVAP